VIDAWMNSPTHRANIVNEKFQDQGLAAIEGAYEPNHDTTMVVNLFGTVYQTTKATPPPATTKTPKAPPVAKSPAPAPATKPTGTQPSKQVAIAPPAPTVPVVATPVAISSDAKIGFVNSNGKQVVNLDIVATGEPTLVNAQLKTQSITLLPGMVAGEFIGSFTFDPTEDLSNQTIAIEARDSVGKKTAQSFPLKLPISDAATSQAGTSTPAAKIPVSTDAEIIKILRVVFGIFAGVYLGFLILDAIIIRRAKIKRAGIHTDPHILVLFLVAVVTLYSSWF
jgi:hypothetical protein